MVEQAGTGRMRGRFLHVTCRAVRASGVPVLAFFGVRYELGLQGINGFLRRSVWRYIRGSALHNSSIPLPLLL